MILRRALRVALVVSVVFIVGQGIFDNANASLSAAFACFSMLTFADFGGPRRNRFLANLALGSFGVLMVIVGSLVGQWQVPAVICTLVIVFAIAYSAVLRGYFAAATAAAILPWAYAVTSPMTGEALFQRTYGWALGVVVVAITSITLWPNFTRSRLRTSLAAVFDTAADLAEHFDDPARLPELNKEFKQAVKTLQSQYRGQLVRPGGGTERDRSLLLAIDETLRLNMSMTWDYSGLAEGLGPVDQALLDESIRCFRECSRALLVGDVIPRPQDLEDARDLHSAGMIEWCDRKLAEDKAAEVRPGLEASTHIRMISLSAQAMAAYVRRAMDPVRGLHQARSESAGGELIKFDGVTLNDPDERISAHSVLRQQFSFKSPWFRTAIRTSIAISATVIVVFLLGAEHGFWASLGALVALKFDSSGTGRTAIQVLVGTVAGFIIGGLLVTVIHDQLFLWILLPIAIFLAAYTPGAISLIVGQASFTVFVIDLVGLTTPDKFSVAEWRLADVIVGILVSLVVSLLMWPHGVAPTVLRSARSAINSATEGWMAAYQRIVDGPLLAEHYDFAHHHALQQEARAVEAFDLAWAQRGPGLGDKTAVVSSLNIAAQMNFASTIIHGLSHVSEIPQQFAAVGDAVLASALRASAQMMSAVSVLAEKESGQVPSGAHPHHESLERLRLTVDEAIAQMNAHSPDRESTRDLRPGHTAVVLVFVMVWIVQAVWMADQMWDIVLDQPAADPETALAAA